MQSRAARGQLCWAPFVRGQMPGSGSIAGQVAIVNGAPTILIASATAAPCQEPSRPPPAAIIVGFRWDLPVGGCVPSGTPIHYRANWIGP